MLGELYRPHGLALETAQAVLETGNVWACNVSFGCTNACRYCYVPRFTRRRRDTCEVRLPKKSPVELVRHQLEHQWRFHWTSKLGVFLSFLTDPFLPQLRSSTEDLAVLLWKHHIRVATLSKVATVGAGAEIRHGMTVVSCENKFRNEFEPNTPSPLTRIAELKGLKENWDQYVWVSMEPFPPSAIYKQRIGDLLEELKFVDLIIFGVWNYDKRARTEEARREYAENIQVLTDFCKSNNIRLHVKTDTLRFIRR